MRIHLHTYARRIYIHDLPDRYVTLTILTVSSAMNASYAISIRQASALPASSCPHNLTVKQLMFPPPGCVRDFHPQVNAPCRAHQTKKSILSGAFYMSDAQRLIEPSCWSKQSVPSTQPSLHCSLFICLFIPKFRPIIKMNNRPLIYKCRIQWFIWKSLILTCQSAPSATHA